MRIISPHELTTLRELYDSLKESTNAANASDRPELAATLTEARRALVRTDYAITVPCLLCKALKPVEVAVNDRAWPQACICQPCADKVDAAVAAVAEGRTEA